MNHSAMLAAALAVLVATPAVADGQAAPKGAGTVADSPAGTATPVRLVSWDGDFELMKESQRMRIWRSHVAYKLTVDAQGEVTGCELTERFRLRRVSDSLCEILSEHHQFEPALDASGTPVAGEYSASMAYADIRARL